MERTQSVAGECFNASVRTFTIGRGRRRIYTGRRDAWKRGLEACGCGHVFKIVARYGIFRGSSVEPQRLGSVYIERKYKGERAHYRAVVAPDAATPAKFKAMGLRFAGELEPTQSVAEHEQVPKALRMVDDFLTRSGLRWELDGVKPGDTEPGDDQ